MTDRDLDHIEAELGFALPAEYRRVSTSFPFSPRGNEWVYWFFDEPNLVIQETRCPLADGGFNGRGWKPGYLAIGESPGGDPYVLDCSQAAGPVLLLSHETLLFEPGWGTFASFVAEWRDAPDDAERHRAHPAEVLKATSRRAWLVAAGLLAATILAAAGLVRCVQTSG